MKFVKLANVVRIFHAAVDIEANVEQEKFVNRILVCVAIDLVAVVLMKFVSTVFVYVRQVRVINAIMHVNRMRLVSMANVFVLNNVKKVIQRFFNRSTNSNAILYLAFCPFPCLNGGRCTGFYQCTCRQGWQGHRCEQRRFDLVGWEIRGRVVLLFDWR